MKRFLFDVKSAYLRFRKNDILSFFYILGIVYAICYFFDDFRKYCHEDDFDAYLISMTVSLRMVKYMFALFLFIAFEYFYSIRSSYMEETIESIYGGRKSFERGNLAVCVIGAFVYWLTLVVINVSSNIYMGMYDVRYNVYIIGVLFVNVFLNLVIAIMVAWVVSKKIGRICAYFILIGIVFLSSSNFEELAELLTYEMGHNIYPVQELFAFLPMGLNWMPNFNNPFMIQAYQLTLKSAWIFGMIAIAFCTKHFGKKIKKKYILPGIAALLCVVLYYMPASKLMMNSDPNGTLYEGELYYWGKEMTEADSVYEEFTPLSYQMDMRFGRELKNKVKIKIEPGNLKCYAFTLFHGFRVKSVKDQDGYNMDFTRKDDYLYVNNDSLKEITEICIYYQGGSSVYYSNSQGIYLPGAFAYYPQPGIRAVYDADSYSYCFEFLPEDVYFEVKLNGVRDVYSNLQYTEDGVFKGYCSGPVFLKGFLKEYEYEDTVIVYPYLNGEYKQSMLEEWINNLKYSLKESCPKQIFFAPNVNHGYTIQYGTDYIIAPYLFGAEEYIEGE